MPQPVMLKKLKLERFYEDLQDLLELTPKKDVLFITGGWNAKVGSQETYGVTGKFDLVVQDEAGQRVTEFCQENTLIIVNKRIRNAVFGCNLKNDRMICLFPRKTIQHHSNPSLYPSHKC